MRNHSEGLLRTFGKASLSSRSEDMKDLLSKEQFAAHVLIPACFFLNKLIHFCRVNEVIIIIVIIIIIIIIIIIGGKCF